MSIEQHAEAAANDIVSRLDGCGLDSVDTRRFAEIIQAAIDEATAPLRARIAQLEGLGPLIEEYGQLREDFGRLVQLWLCRKANDIKDKIDAILKGGSP